jgi:membrane protein implicated in regulation of membrane protease activity
MRSTAVVLLWIAAAACAVAAVMVTFRDSRAGIGMGAVALVFAVIAAPAGKRSRSTSPRSGDELVINSHSYALDQQGR